MILPGKIVPQLRGGLYSLVHSSRRSFRYSHVGMQNRFNELFHEYVSKPPGLTTRKGSVTPAFEVGHVQ
jgi:hypothetical protein